MFKITPDGQWYIAPLNNQTRIVVSEIIDSDAFLKQMAHSKPKLMYRNGYNDTVISRIYKTDNGIALQKDRDDGESFTFLLHELVRSDYVSLALPASKITHDLLAELSLVTDEIIGYTRMPMNFTGVEYLKAHVKKWHGSILAYSLDDPDKCIRPLTPSNVDTIQLNSGLDTSGDRATKDTWSLDVYDTPNYIIPQLRECHEQQSVILTDIFIDTNQYHTLLSIVDLEAIKQENKLTEFVNSDFLTDVKKGTKVTINNRIQGMVLDYIGLKLGRCTDKVIVVTLGDMKKLQTSLYELTLGWDNE